MTKRDELEQRLSELREELRVDWTRTNMRQGLMDRLIGASAVAVSIVLIRHGADSVWTTLSAVTFMLFGVSSAIAGFTAKDRK